MRIGKVLLLAMALGLVTTAFAGEETKMKIIVVEDSGDGEMVWVDEEGGADIDVHVMRKAVFMGEDHMGSTMIMSAEPIDAATQQIIKSALEAAGHDSEVHFVTHGAHHSANHDGEHHVKVIRKVIETKE